MITFLMLYLCWALYLAIMSLYRAKRENTLPKAALWLGYPLLIVGHLIDFLCNIILTPWFWDWPREWLVSGRLQRYSHGKDGWRRNAGIWFAKNLLDPFDPKGQHIKPRIEDKLE